MTGVVLGFHHEGAVQFVLVHLDAVEAPDLRKQKPETHPALGNLPVLVLEFVVALALVFRVVMAVAAFFLDLLPYGLEFALDHPRRHIELVGIRQGIQQLTLQLRPAQPVVVALKLFADLGP